MKSAAEEGAGHGCDAVHAADETTVQRPALQEDGVGEDDQGSGEDGSGADAGDRTTDDERHAIVRDAADQASQLEDGDVHEEDPLDAEEGVELAEEKLQSRGREEIS